ncbi:protein TolQ [Delftia tsuruhatensis]|uniref:protein TolQ n=1 Tax=Delftia tsuruhatensis TaxID=180282 RepID=UPI0009BAE648|nr:protein TolQ [Delftia tsuruhatensis]
MNSHDMSILSLVLQASWVVQLVMLILVGASVASWATIFRKSQTLKRVRTLNDGFEQDFWSGTSLNDLYASAAHHAKQGGPMERIFASGMREYQKLRERRIADVNQLMDGTRRAMRASFQREMDEVESGLSFLGTVGSVSPYVGLFGTVWGIYHALVAIGLSGQSSIDKVAGPIGEALIMTALGLAVAIPAVLGYNAVVRGNKSILNALNSFAHDMHAYFVTGARVSIDGKEAGNVLPLKKGA